jgi:hypothetical protein
MTPDHDDEVLAYAKPAEHRKIGMTLDELGRFVQQAHRLGFDGTARVRADIGWRQQIQKIKIGEN